MTQTIINGGVNPGAGSFTIPSGVTSITIEGIGTGGGITTLGSIFGGGGGAYAKSTIACAPGNTLYYYVGYNGGAGDTWAHLGVNAAPTDPATGIVADGAALNANASGGVGGQASHCVGQVVFSGGNGGTGSLGTGGSAGGGGAAGPDGPGGNGGIGGGNTSIGGGGGGGANGGADGQSIISSIAGGVGGKAGRGGLGGHSGGVIGNQGTGGEGQHGGGGGGAYGSPHWNGGASTEGDDCFAPGYGAGGGGGGGYGSLSQGGYGSWFGGGVGVGGFAQWGSPGVLVLTYATGLKTAIAVGMIG